LVCMKAFDGVLIVDLNQKHFSVGRQTEISPKGRSNDRSQIASERVSRHSVTLRSWTLVDLTRPGRQISVDFPPAFDLAWHSEYGDWIGVIQRKQLAVTLLTTLLKKKTARIECYCSGRKEEPSTLWFSIKITNGEAPRIEEHGFVSRYSRFSIGYPCVAEPTRLRRPSSGYTNCGVLRRIHTPVITMTPHFTASRAVLRPDGKAYAEPNYNFVKKGGFRLP
jgi:hypothetical protein